MTAISNEARQMLVRHLAWLQSPWRPLRRDYNQSGAAWAARSNPHHADGGDARRRKASQRLRAELRAAGLFDRAGINEAGKRVGRGWVWPFDRAELIEAIDRIDQHTKAGHCRPNGFVPEQLIVGRPYSDWPDPFGLLQALLGAAAADGVIELGSTVDGAAFYKLRVPWPDGRDRLAVDDAHDFDEALADQYNAESAAVWRGIVNDQCYHKEIGELPLAGSGELVSRRDADDVTGIEPLFPDTLEKSTPRPTAKQPKSKSRRIEQSSS